MSDVPRIEVTIAGTPWRQWASVELTSAVEQLAPEFSLQLADVRPAAAREFIFDEGSECHIDVDGERVVTGYLTRPTISYGPRHYTIAVTGRSKTIDLVECSAEIRRWRSASALQVAKDLCSPYGIEVAATESLEKLEKFATQTGETVADALERIAVSQGLILLADSFGNVILTRSARDDAGVPMPFLDPVKVLRGDRDGDWSERYSVYEVLSQRGTTRRFSGKDAADQSFSVTDPQVTRHRPWFEVSDGRGKAQELERQARHEMNRRAGRSKLVTYELAGWRHDLGLWRPNQFVHVRDDRLFVEGPMLVSRVVLRGASDPGAGGFLATIDLVRPETFDVLRPPTKRPATRGRRDWAHF